jgi:hypothetical protein
MALKAVQGSVKEQISTASPYGRWQELALQLTNQLKDGMITVDGIFNDADD